MITDCDSRYYLVVWRRPKFFLFNYIQPAVLINIIALFVFLIPAESGEKVTLGISTMLNMTVFLMTVTSGIPPTDNTPILSEILAPLLTSYLIYLQVFTTPQWWCWPRAPPASVWSCSGSITRADAASPCLRTSAGWASGWQSWHSPNTLQWRGSSRISPTEALG